MWVMYDNMLWVLTTATLSPRPFVIFCATLCFVCQKHVVFPRGHLSKGCLTVAIQEEPL